MVAERCGSRQVIRCAHPAGRRKLRCLATLDSNPSGILTLQFGALNFGEE